MDNELYSLTSKMRYPLLPLVLDVEGITTHLDSASNVQLFLIIQPLQTFTFVIFTFTPIPLASLRVLPLGKEGQGTSVHEGGII